MHSHAHFRQHKYADQRSFLIYFATLLIVSKHVSSVNCEGARNTELPGFQDYPTNPEDDDFVGDAKDGDNLDIGTNWILILPYLPVGFLVIVVCICRGCGYTQVKSREAGTGATEEPPIYTIATYDSYYLDNEQLPAGANIPVWTPAPPYSSVVLEEKPGVEEEPPAYDTLFEVKEMK